MTDTTTATYTLDPRVIAADAYSVERTERGGFVLTGKRGGLVALTRETARTDGREVYSVACLSGFNKKGAKGTDGQYHAAFTLDETTNTLYDFHVGTPEPFANVAESVQTVIASAEALVAAIGSGDVPTAALAIVAEMLQTPEATATEQDRVMTVLVAATVQHWAAAQPAPEADALLDDEPLTPTEQDVYDAADNMPTTFAEMCRWHERTIAPFQAAASRVSAMTVDTPNLTALVEWADNFIGPSGNPWPVPDSVRAGLTRQRIDSLRACSPNPETNPIDEANHIEADRLEWELTHTAAALAQAARLAAIRRDPFARDPFARSVVPPLTHSYGDPPMPEQDENPVLGHVIEPDGEIGEPVRWSDFDHKPITDGEWADATGCPLPEHLAPSIPDPDDDGAPMASPWLPDPVEPDPHAIVASDSRAIAE